MSDKQNHIQVPEQSEKEGELAAHDPNHINPKVASDIAHWAKEFGVTGQILHEAIRVHGTSVEKIRTALKLHEVNLS